MCNNNHQSVSESQTYFKADLRFLTRTQLDANPGTDFLKIKLFQNPSLP